jgi:TetR/AcrR family transcriptional regulator, cholesterol catabolism regulator
MSKAKVPTDRREQILTLAASMFFERGFEATTIRDLAKELDLKSASIYHFFEDKEQLLFELVTAATEQLTASAKQLLAAEDSYDLKLAALIVNHVVLHALRPADTTLGDTELRSLTGKRREENTLARDRYEEIVVKVLRDGARHGGFDLFDTRLTAYALIAQNSSVGIWYRPGGRLSLEQVAYVQAGLALRSVGAEPVAQREVRRLCTAARDFHEVRS